MVTTVTPTTPGALNGPGTLTLSSALTYDHKANTLFTTLPYTVIEACIQFAVAKSLTRGTSAIVAQTMGGREMSTAGKIDEAVTAAKAKLCAYRRIL